MKIIPLVLLLGATPVLAQDNAAKPQATEAPAKAAAPSKTAKSTRKSKTATAEVKEQAVEKKENEKKAPSRAGRVFRRSASPPPRIIAREVEPAKPQSTKPETVEERKKQETKAKTKAKEQPKARNTRKTAETAKKQAEAKPAESAPPAKATGRRTARTVRETRATAKAAPAPKTSGATEGAEAQPAKKGGPFSFFGRIFGGGKKEEAPAAENNVMVGPPKPTPAPRNQRGGGRSTARHEMADAADEVDHEAALPSYQRPHQSPPIAVHRTVSDARGEMVPVDLNDDLPAATPRRIQPIPAALPQAQPPAPAKAAVVAAPFDRTRYQETRRKAAEDPAISALGDQLNATTPGEEAHSGAARAYTTALFGKMREMDPAQADWINRMEAATMRRIDAGKPVLAE